MTFLAENVDSVVGFEASFMESRANLLIVLQTKREQNLDFS